MAEQGLLRVRVGLGRKVTLDRNRHAPTAHRGSIGQDTPNVPARCDAARLGDTRGDVLAAAEAPGACTAWRLSLLDRQGAFYVLANISQLGLSSTNFADRLLSKHHVAVVPGVAFGHDGTIRFSYATSLDIIKKGLDRFEEFCRTL